jgi:ABC-type multidrug transport system fused ATPase/permease subunit
MSYTDTRPGFKDRDRTAGSSVPVGRLARRLTAMRSSWHRYALLLRYARPHAKGWLVIGVVTLLSVGVSLLVPLPLMVLVDNVVGHHSRPGYLAWLPGSANRDVLLAYVIAAELAFFALASALDVLLTLLWIKVGQKMVYELSEDLFARVQRRSLRDHARHPVGETLQRVVGDSWTVSTVVGELVLTPVQAVITIAGLVVVMVSLNPGLTVVTCLMAPVTVAASFLLGRRMRQAGRRRRDLEGQLQSHVQQTLTGIGVVQAFGAEGRQRERFRELTQAALRSQLRMTFVGGLNGLGSGVAAAFGAGVILLVGGQDVLGGSLSVGGLVIFMTYVRRLQGELGGSANFSDESQESGGGGLGGIYSTLQGVRSSIDRIVEVLDAPVEVCDGPGAVVLDPGSGVAGHVVFEGVWFGYERGRSVLRGIDFEAAPGEVVAIVGATGAGKSTLVSLVPRFADPDRGRVLLDGRDLRDLSLASVRGSVSLVLQESFLFPFSIAENIAFGRPGASREEIERAARAANAHEFISRLPEGYDTVVGERGATLSGGERQRVAIARALLKDAPVLILDEPTSSLDAKTESQVLEALERLMVGRTTLIIAHRLSTIRHADRIVVLNHGRLVEQGTQQQLLRQNGLYGELYDLQHERRVVLA